MNIDIDHLAVTYRTLAGERVGAVLDFDLHVRRGEFVAIVGPSGCGKSTVLNVLSGLVAPTAGRVAVNEAPVTAPRPDVSVVFQESRLLPWLDVLDNVMIPITVQRKPREAFLARAQELLATTGLADFRASYPNELSGGMQQRVAICRALVHDPAVLLMDEPFGALDALTREVMNLELLRIWGATGKTVLFVTHSIPEAVFLADRVVIMTARPGRIRATLAVDLPRPRTLESMAAPAFAALTGEIRRILNAAGDFH